VLFRSGVVPRPSRLCFVLTEGVTPEFAPSSKRTLVADVVSTMPEPFVAIDAAVGIEGDQRVRYSPSVVPVAAQRAFGHPAFEVDDAIAARCPIATVIAAIDPMALGLHEDARMALIEQAHGP